MGTNRVAAFFADQGESALDHLFEALSRKQRFEPGRRVRVCFGVLEGVEGTVLAYCSAVRLLIAVHLNFQGVTLEIDEQMLGPLDALDD